MDFETLTDENLKLYAIKHYDNPFCSGFDEFEEDFKIPKYIKKLLNKYDNGEELKERLILNHIICFYNMFGQEAATKILFFRVEEKHYSILKTFLVFLNRCPDSVDYGNIRINVKIIPFHQDTINKLRKI